MYEIILLRHTKVRIDTSFIYNFRDEDYSSIRIEYSLFQIKYFYEGNNQ